MALSPDGARLVYSATSGDRPQLYLRNIDQFDAEPIAGTEGGTSPFFSPDGQWLGFFAASKLQKVPLSGGAPQTICDVPSFVGNGVTWGADGTIIFARSLGGLARVSAEGGDPETLTTLAFDEGEYAHASPHFLPDRKHVLSPSGEDIPRSRYCLSRVANSVFSSRQPRMPMASIIFVPGTSFTVSVAPAGSSACLSI
jgi:serine/threonine-protein kinase